MPPTGCRLRFASSMNQTLSLTGSLKTSRPTEGEVLALVAGFPVSYYTRMPECRWLSANNRGVYFAA